MGRRRWTLRYECNHPGCSANAHHDFRSLSDLKQQLAWSPKEKWFCVRHTKAEEVMSSRNNVRAQELTCFEEPHGRYWGTDKPSTGFVYGPGFKAYAKDFPPGTKIRVTAELILPESDRSQPSGG